MQTKLLAMRKLRLKNYFANASIWTVEHMTLIISGERKNRTILHLARSMVK